MPVLQGPCPVIPHGGPRVGVRGSFLHIPQRHPGIKGGGDERVPQSVGSYRLADPGASGNAADDPPRTVAVQPRPLGGGEDRSLEALSNRQVDRPAVRGASGMVTTLPPLRVMTSVRWLRSVPMASMSAPVASETRSLFSASSEISACSAALPSPAATSSAPSSLRSAVASLS
jgi:hypothetical protein